MADDSTQFPYDVFLSHSSQDKAVVRAIAERLRADGLRVWLDDWVLRPGDHVQAKVDEALEQSRVLVLCMSAQAFGSEWARLEAGTFRFRDPLNKERRFIPLRLDDAHIPSALEPFLYIDWRAPEREPEYARLLEACRPPAKQGAPTGVLEDISLAQPQKEITVPHAPMAGDSSQGLLPALQFLRQHTNFLWAELFELSPYHDEFTTEIKETTYEQVKMTLDQL